MYVLETTVEVSSDNNVSKTQSFSNKVGIVEQVRIKVRHDLLDGCLSSIDRLLVVWISSNSGTEPCTNGWKNFRVCKGTPLKNFSIRFDILGEDRSVGVLVGN
jgi:hypothetical protein